MEGASSQLSRKTSSSLTPRPSLVNPWLGLDLSHGPSHVEGGLSFPLEWSELCHMTLPRQSTDSPKSPLKLEEGHLP